jgi:ribonuclease-3
MKNIFERLENKIGLKFKDTGLLRNIFIHRSYLNENRHVKLISNEKLEFLGDSVLSLITSVYLYKKFPYLEEGEYTEIKSSIVRTESLTEAAANLNLGDYLLLSKGQDQEGGRKNKNILADCFEALIGGIFIDLGFEKAYYFVTKFLFAKKLDYIINNKLYLSPKSHLQEFTQSRYRVTPVYNIIEERGPEHERIFRVAVFVNKKRLALASGKSKKEAEEKAAKIALEKLT